MREVQYAHAPALGAVLMRGADEAIRRGASRLKLAAALPTWPLCMKQRETAEAPRSRASLAMPTRYRYGPSAGSRTLGSSAGGLRASNQVDDSSPVRRRSGAWQRSGSRTSRLAGRPPPTSVPASPWTPGRWRSGGAREILRASPTPVTATYRTAPSATRRVSPAPSPTSAHAPTTTTMPLSSRSSASARPTCLDGHLGGHCVGPQTSCMQATCGSNPGRDAGGPAGLPDPPALLRPLVR